MAKVNPLKNVLNAGEFSPRMIARSEFPKYEGGTAKLLNFQALVQGGISRRPGSRYVVEIKSSAAKPRLLRFEFSTDQAYAIEAGNLYFRFYKDQGQITATNITGSVTNGTFDSGIASWTNNSGSGSAISHDGTNNALSLDSNGTTTAAAEQQITNSSGIDHTLQFRILPEGIPPAVEGTENVVYLRIGTSTTGTQILSDKAFGPGYHMYTFTATAANFYLQFVYPNGTAAVSALVDNISLTDNAAIELETPYTTAQLSALKFAQTGDIMYITHPSHPPHKLERSGHDIWSLTQVAFIDGPYLDVNITSTTMAAASTTGSEIVITASAVTGVNNGSGFVSTDVGRLIRIAHTSNEPGYALITSVTDTTHVKVLIERGFNATSAQTTWSLGAWSGTTGYPACIGFFEQRLGVASTSTQTQTFWLSQSADLENFRPDSFVGSAVVTEDDDSLNFTIAAREVNKILWIDGGTQLIIGTSGGPWVAESDGAVLTPNDIQVRRRSSRGSADIQPIRIDEVLLFLSRALTKLIEFVFSFEANGYKTPDLTILAEHILRGGGSEIAYQEEPGSLVWVVKVDGSLVSMTYRREEDVVGWTPHQMGGSFQTGIAIVDSLITIPGNSTTSSQSRDEIWMVVKRTINNATVRFVEFLEGDYEGPLENVYSTKALWQAAIIEAQKDAFYLDSGLSLDTKIIVSGATKANPVVVTAAAHGLSNGDYIEAAEVTGMIELNGNSYRIADQTTNNFKLTGVEGPLITAATVANPVVITSVAHGLSNGNTIGIYDVLGMTEINGIVFTVANKTANTFELSGINGSGYTAYTEGGTMALTTNGTAFTTYVANGVVRKKVSSISGLTHLEGATVKVLADGAVHPDKTVSSGAITLDYRAARVHVGLGYTHTYKSLKLDYGSKRGTAINKIKRVNKVGSVLQDAAAFKLGPSETATVDVTFRKADDPMDTAVPLFTGERLSGFDGGHDRDARVVYTSDNPLPFTLLAMTPEMQESDGV
jgi:hypothetical protein